MVTTFKFDPHTQLSFTASENRPFTQFKARAQKQTDMYEDLSIINCYQNKKRANKHSGFSDFHLHLTSVMVVGYLASCPNRTTKMGWLWSNFIKGVIPFSKPQTHIHIGISSFPHYITIHWILPHRLLSLWIQLIHKGLRDRPSISLKSYFDHHNVVTLYSAVLKELSNL